MKRKTKAQQLRANNNKKLREWSKIIHEKYNHKCVICGSTEYLNAHHCLEKKYYPQTKYDPGVGVLLCVKHHKFGKYAAHHNALYFTSWLQENLPEVYEYCKALL